MLLGFEQVFICLNGSSISLLKFSALPTFFRVMYLASVVVVVVFGHNSAPFRARDLGTSKNKVWEGEEFDFEV